MEKFEYVGALVEGTGVIRVSSKVDSTDTGGCVVKGNSAISTLEDELQLISEGSGAGDVSAVVDVHV